MTFLSTLLRPRNLGPESPAVPLTSTTLLDWLSGPRVQAGVNVNETSALGMPAVWRAVNLIAGTAAALPLHAYRRDGNKRVLMDTGKTADLLADPHPDMTPFELWQLGYGSFCTWGNAYYRKLRDQFGAVTELWWLAPWRVRVGRDPETAQKFYIIDGHTDNPWYDKDILHIPGFGYDGVCGVSPIRAARQGIGLALAAEEYGARLFGNGSLATGMLQTEQRIDQEEADELKALWRSGGTGLESAHDIRVMGSGAQWVQLTIPPQDAQFLQSRHFQIEEIARMFGIPNHLLMQVEKQTSWGTGIEQQTLGWLMFGLNNYLTPFEQRITKMIRPAAAYARYSLAGLLRGDAAARATFYRQLWEMGVLSTNEIRELEERDPVEGGDVRYRPLNFGELGQPNPAPVPAPAPSQEALTP